MSKERDFNELLHFLERQYPHGVTTCNICPTAGCPNMARGWEVCADCIERKLGELTNEQLASAIHASIKSRARAISDALDFINNLVVPDYFKNRIAEVG